MVDADELRAREYAADQGAAAWGQLDESEQAALKVIVEGRVPRRPWVTKHREAWRTRDQMMEAGVTDEAVDALVVRKLAIHWDTPHGRLLTLTPWGAFVAQVVMDEQYVLDFEANIEIEIPFWTELHKASDCVVLPDRAREYRMLFPELVADPDSEQDSDLFDEPKSPYVLDEWSGEPIALFQGEQDVPRDDGHLRGGVGSAPLSETLFGGVPIERDRAPKATA